MFLWFCIDIGRKWFRLWFGIGLWNGWKCWFLWGFTILGAILEVWGWMMGKWGFYWVWWDFGLGAWKLSLCIDEPAYRLPGKQNICSSFWYPLTMKSWFFSKLPTMWFWILCYIVLKTGIYRHRIIEHLFDKIE